MDVKTCEFDCPVEKRYSTGFYKGMFNEDVKFNFEVTIKGTDPKEITEMLTLFNQAAKDFNDTWTQKLVNKQKPTAKR